MIIEGEPFQVRVWFSRELEVYIRERHFSEGQYIEAANEGIILTFTARSDIEVVAWVLGFGRKAKALDPPWLVERVRSEVEGMGARYSIHNTP